MKEYTTMFNGGYFYKVTLKDTLSVFNLEKKQTVILNHPYLGVYIDNDMKDDIGNTVLIKLTNNSYMFIGEKIYTFKLKDDSIIDYKSPIGNSAVPYPYAIGKKNVYLMTEQVFIPIEKTVGTLPEDMYQLYYMFDIKNIKTRQREVKKYKKNHGFKIKILDANHL